MQGRQNDAFPIWLWCYRAFESGKKRKVRCKCKAHKKAGPQFALANEEPAYRSATQQLPAICVFYARVRTYFK